jgi:hypothetical protein
MQEPSAVVGPLRSPIGIGMSASATTNRTIELVTPAAKPTVRLGRRQGVPVGVH